MSTGSTLIIYSLCIWTVIPCLVFFIYKKRNPKKRNPSQKPFKSSPSQSPSPWEPIIIEAQENEKDPRSLSQLQVERQRLLSNRQKAVLTHQRLQKSLQAEKSPKSIALSLALKTWRLKIQKISLLKNRLDMLDVDIQHLNDEIRRIETILASMRTEQRIEARIVSIQSEKKPTKQAKQAQQQDEEEGITPQQALFNKNFLPSLKEAFAKRTPQELGIGIQPKDKAIKSFSKEDRLNAEMEKKILSGILPRRPKRSKDDLDRSYVIEEEQNPGSNLLLPTSASSLVQWGEVSWEEVSNEEKEIPCAEKNENEFLNNESFLDIEKLDGFQNEINIKRLR